MRLCSIVVIVIAGFFLATPGSAAPNVVTSIKPVHSLVSAVMRGAGVPHLIVDGAATPHTFSLRPSDASALADAGLIFWIGPNLENFLAGSLANLAPSARSVVISELPGLKLLPVREGSRFEQDGHGHDHDPSDSSAGIGDGEHGSAGAHEHGSSDMHLWLDPENAIIIVEAAAAALSASDPENADIYSANAALTIARLQDLQAEISASLAPAAGTPFVSFHDAFQYFEHRFGLSAMGAITLNPESRPGARRVADIRAMIASLNIMCVFSEPQFDPALIATVTEGSAARTGTLDPMGAGIEDGPDLYFTMLRRMAQNVRACLTP